MPKKKKKKVDVYSLLHTKTGSSCSKTHCRDKSPLLQHRLTASLWQFTFSYLSLQFTFLCFQFIFYSFSIFSSSFVSGYLTFQSYYLRDKQIFWIKQLYKRSYSEVLLSVKSEVTVKQYPERVARFYLIQGRDILRKKYIKAWPW